MKGQPYRIVAYFIIMQATWREEPNMLLFKFWLIQERQIKDL